jgi:hypothetical protein
MNPRLREIAFECWNERINCRQFDQEMFAERIIRKCIEIDVENPDAAPGVEIAKYFGLNDDTNI